jgi:hypothetical protein
MEPGPPRAALAKETALSEPLRILHGLFGRIVLVRLDRAMALHAHRHCHIVFKVGGQDIRFGIRDREHPLCDDSVLLINAWEPHFYEHRTTAEPTVLPGKHRAPASSCRRPGSGCVGALTGPRRTGASDPQRKPPPRRPAG